MSNNLQLLSIHSLYLRHILLIYSKLCTIHRVWKLYLTKNQLLICNSRTIMEEWAVVIVSIRTTRLFLLYNVWRGLGILDFLEGTLENWLCKKGGAERETCAVCVFAGVELYLIILFTSVLVSLHCCARYSYLTIVIYCPDTAYARNHEDDQWYSYDDSSVTPISESEIVVSNFIFYLLE